MLKIITIQVTPFAQNCRILIEGSKASVIDPGGDVSEILKHCSGLNVESVLLTHAHIDHAGGVKEFIEVIKSEQVQRPKLYGHLTEKEMRSRISDQALMFGLSPAEYQNCPEPDEYIEDGSRVKLGALSLMVLFTPGHSPGHVSYYLEKGQGDIKNPIVFGGDALFQGSIGRTDLPRGNFNLLIESIKQKLLTLPDETIVLSGHGPDTTIGEEKRNNPFL